MDMDKRLKDTDGWNSLKRGPSEHRVALGVTPALGLLAIQYGGNNVMPRSPSSESPSALGATGGFWGAPGKHRPTCLRPQVPGPSPWFFPEVQRAPCRPRGECYGPRWLPRALRENAALQCGFPCPAWSLIEVLTTHHPSHPDLAPQCTAQLTHPGPSDKPCRLPALPAAHLMPGQTLLTLGSQTTQTLPVPAWGPGAAPATPRTAL